MQVPERTFQDLYHEWLFGSIHRIFKKLWSILANFCIYIAFSNNSEKKFANIDHNFLNI